MTFWEFANPTRFMALSARLLPWITVLALLTFVGGVAWGFFGTPDDYQQGATVKILYIHAPAAMLAINAWFMMVVCSIIWLIRRHHVSALAAKAAAPVGAVLTVIALVTGALWGAPLWGTWWEWDPRLTSFFILFVFYLGYLALWSSVDEPDRAADLTSILCLVGSVFAVLSRYAVDFWSQGLHQGSSLSIDKEEHVADVFYWPLLLSLAGFFLMFLALVILRTRTEIRRRRILALQRQRGVYA